MSPGVPRAWIPRSRARVALRLALLGAIVLATSSGCATYSEQTALARHQADAGDYESSAKGYSKLIGVDGIDIVPDSFDDDTSLLLAERAMTLQALALYEESARDLQVADKQLELLDLTNDPVGTLGKYVYSDSATVYKAPPFEKLALNSVNMLNYLALGDLREARVEAKRFTVMHDYVEGLDPKGAHGTIGSYLAGLVFEYLGEPGTAMRYYDEALDDRALETLKEPIARLSERSHYAGRNTARVLNEVSREPGGLARFSPAALADDDSGEIVTIIALGRVPYRMPRRIPVGAAIGVAGAWVTGDVRVLRHSLGKVVVYPELVPATSSFQEFRVAVDEETETAELVSNFASEATREYELMKPKIIAAALSRMLARAVIAEGVRVAGDQYSEGLGTAVSLLTEGLLVSADKPDTRSWTLLPARIFVARKRVAPGAHEVSVWLRGNGLMKSDFEVEVPPGGLATIVVTSLR